MFDLNHEWGGDLSAGPTGDLALASGTFVGQQRVLRRLMTNLGEYIWQLGYGAGLAQFLGHPADPLQIRAVIRSQVFKEPVVSRTPEPTIAVQIDPASGSVYVDLRYVDASSGETQVLTFSVSA